MQTIRKRPFDHESGHEISTSLVLATMALAIRTAAPLLLPGQPHTPGTRESVWGVPASPVGASRPVIDAAAKYHIIANGFPADELLK
jgi:hypothetical protein